MMIILIVLGLCSILAGASVIQTVFGTHTDDTIVAKVSKSLISIFSSLWSWMKKGYLTKGVVVLGGVSLIACGVFAFWVISWKMEMEQERTTGVLGMSKLDWMYVAKAARDGKGQRVEFPRPWLGDSIEVQQSESQFRLSHQGDTLVRVCAGQNADTDIYFVVSPKGVTTEWTPPWAPTKK